MALSGLDIYKHLPKTNCKDCGFPTCLAFAMKLAAKQAELSLCPHVSEEAKQVLDAASAPPIRLIAVGTGDAKIEVGNETVLFRHDKTFFHEPGLFVRVKDNQPEADVAKLVQTVAGYSVERVGMNLRVNGFAVENASGDAQGFAKCVGLVKGKSDLALILMAASPAAMDAALAVAGSDKPLIYAATEDNWEAMVELAKKYQCPLAVRAKGEGDPSASSEQALSALATLVEQVTKAGVADVVLDPGAKGLRASLEAQTIIRRLAIRKNFRLLGFPTIVFAGEGADSPLEEAVNASQAIAKYAGFIVLDSFDPSLVYPLLTLRQNIYTDPQKPIQVKPDVYAFNEPKDSSPLLITTNFSLTYFTVAGEVEASGVPTWLLIADSEGLSVLTAWAAGKFDAEKIAKTVKGSGVSDKVSHRKLVIPGAISGLSGEIEEELAGWKVVVGPRDAVDISPFLKSGKA